MPISFNMLSLIWSGGAGQHIWYRKTYQKAHPPAHVWIPPKDENRNNDTREEWKTYQNRLGVQSHCFQEPQENTPKTKKKIPKMRIFGILGVFFFRYFRGILGSNSGSPEFRAAGYFFGIFRGNSGSGHSGALRCFRGFPSWGCKFLR